MRTVFADTFCWIALTNPRDASHQKVVRLRQSLGSARLVTTDEVLGEFLTFMAGFGPSMRADAVRAVERLLTSPHVQVLPQSRDSFLRALALYAVRPDKGYSLTDCSSMASMREHGIIEVLTQDHHFAQEGFVLVI
jgi:predicted nucleic acid-binding protein